MQRRISSHWIADMYLIFAILVALQLLSSTTSRSLHSENGDKVSSGRIAKLLLPLLNSENAKDDFKVRVVPYKDYSKEGKNKGKRKINHDVETPKRKGKKDLPVAIIIAEQDHKHHNKKLKSKNNVIYKHINDKSANSDENSSVEDTSDVDISNSLEDNGKAHPKIHGYSLKSLKSLLGKLLKNVKRKTLHIKPGHEKRKNDTVTNKYNSVTEEDDSVTIEDNSVTIEDNSATIEDNSVTNEDNSSVSAEDNSVIDEDNSVTDEDNSVTDEDNSLTYEDNSVTDENNSVTAEDKSFTDEDNSVTDEDKSVTNEKNSLTHEDNIKNNENNNLTAEDKSMTKEDNSNSNDAVTKESHSQDKESNSSVTTEEHSDSNDKDSDNNSSRSAEDETTEGNQNNTDLSVENSSSASDISTSSIEHKKKTKHKHVSSVNADDDDEDISISHDNNSENRSENSDYKKEDIDTEENITHESDYDILNEEIFDALLNGELDKGIYAPSGEFETNGIVDKNIYDANDLDNGVHGLKYIPVEQLSNEAIEDGDRQLHYIYKPPYHPYVNFGSDSINDDIAISEEKHKHNDHKPKHKKHVVPNKDDSHEKSIESNDDNNSNNSNEFNKKKDSKRKKCLKEKKEVAKKVKKFEKQIKWKLHDVINKLKRRYSAEKNGKKINITFNFSTQIFDDTKMPTS